GVLALVDASSLIDAMPALSVRLPGSVGVGETIDVDVRIVPRASRRVALTLRCETRGSLDAGADVELATEGRPLDGSLPVTAPCRGPGELTAVWVRASGRLGLLHRIERVTAEAATKVLPSLEAVRRLAMTQRASDGRGGAPTTLRRHGSGTEFDEVQPYSAGMDTRAIDWKASARHGELRVRRFRLEQHQRIVVMLDTGRAMIEHTAGLARIDHGIHTGLALAQVALANGDQVALHAYGVRPRAWVPPGSGVRHLRKLTRVVAELHAEERESNPVHAVRDLMSRLNRRSIVVVISDLHDATSTELMTEALQSLARSHLVVLVALADDDTRDPLAQPPATMEAVARSLVLHDLARERARALERLEGCGAHVLSSPPGLAATQLMKRYLELKRRLG
ncbi:MAG TPA: DUF58 domain-containing protein, partial [Nannocystaceae bacterium]|nr:DUF58 domain-containing protein [Nannocystaceae bacterium]